MCNNGLHVQNVFIYNFSYGFFVRGSVFGARGVSWVRALVA